MIFSKIVLLDADALALGFAVHAPHAAGDLHFAHVVLFHLVARGLGSLAERLDHGGGVFFPRASVENSDFHIPISFVNSNLSG